MRRALDLAVQAARRGEVPVGCVISCGGRIVGEGANARETDFDPTAHAEIVAIRAAAAKLGSWRLTDCALVVTCEPCPMCAGAIVQARIPLVVYGCDDPKGGGVASRYGIGIDGALNHRFELVRGVMEVQSSTLLRDFFARLRT
ncbi:MAG: nucleoside deaminase [Deltaproteobacteria bacterium]|nr:nucleoside deaminase [Deltaproteobacteria bacterium]